MNFWVVFCLLTWGHLCLGVFSLEIPLSMRLPRSPQMPPIVSARQPSKSKSVTGGARATIQIEQKSSHRHPYLTRYEYNEEQSYRSDASNESRKRAAMPSSPFIASRISVSDKQNKNVVQPIQNTIQEIIPPINYFPKYEKNKKSSSPERSIKQYLNLHNYSYNKKDRYPAGTYSKVLETVGISDEEARSILFKKGVVFEEFVNFIAGGASMEQVKQILNVTDLSDLKLQNKTNNIDYLTEKHKTLFRDSSPNRLPPSKKKTKLTKKVRNSSLDFDANALPSKDSPIIAHFRKPPTKSKDIGSASILSMSVEKKETSVVPNPVSKERYHPHKLHNSLAHLDHYQSDQATFFHPEFRFEDGLRMFLIICGSIGGIILIVTVILVIYNILTCKESRMAQRNYELSKQIRKVEESLDIS